MKISKANKEYLIKNIEGAKELIESDSVGDLLAIIDEFLIEDEIENEEPSKKAIKLQEIYDKIDEDNPE